eukprot:778071-Rhodomonas_salina.1
MDEADADVDVALRCHRRTGSRTWGASSRAVTRCPKQLKSSHCASQRSVSASSFDACFHIRNAPTTCMPASMRVFIRNAPTQRDCVHTW